MRKVVGILISFLLCGYIFSAFILPRYTRSELKDKKFIKGEIKRILQIRDKLLMKEKRASQLERMSIETDLRNLDVALELLKYVEKNGYRDGDKNLLKLKYFSLKPHVLKPAKKEKKIEYDPKVYEVSQKGITPPLLVGKPEITFTNEFKSLSGVVKVMLIIGYDGRVLEAKVLETPEKKVGDFIAKYIKENWRFKPAIKDGKPVKVRYRYAIDLSK